MISWLEYFRGHSLFNKVNQIKDYSGSDAWELNYDNWKDGWKQKLRTILCLFSLSMQDRTWSTVEPASFTTIIPTSAYLLSFFPFCLPLFILGCFRKRDSSALIDKVRSSFHTCNSLISIPCKSHCTPKLQIWTLIYNCEPTYLSTLIAFILILKN